MQEGNEWSRTVLATLLRAQIRRIARYLREHEGWPKGKAEIEARRVIKLIGDAAQHETDRKYIKQEVDRALESPEERQRREQVAALLARLERVVNPHRPLSREFLRGVSEIRRYSRTVHAPTAHRVARLKEKIDRLELALLKPENSV
jgi:hypothetical protein